MPAIYLYIYYNAGLYADFGINIYYLIIALYGWLAWKYNFRIFRKGKDKENSKLMISRIPAKNIVILSIVFLVIWCAIAFALIGLTDSTVPVSDAFTTALSIVGMYMLARKYLEQWFVWAIVDVVSVGLYIYKELYFTAALYAVYAIIAIFGYRKWQKIMQSNG